jgi:hypothetical protein
MGLGCGGSRVVLPPLVVTDFKFSWVGSGCIGILPDSEEGKEAATGQVEFLSFY